MNTNGPRAIDPTLLKMYGFATLEETDMAIRIAITYLDRLILQRIPRPKPGANGTWSPLVITPFLKLCHELVEKELKMIVAVYPSFQWLWYLRRLPTHVFSGGLKTTFGYDSMLAETVTGYGRSNKPLSIRDGQIVYDIKQKEVRLVLKLCEYVRFLSQIHVLLRYAGKGVNFLFTDHGLPEQIATSEQEASIRFYDTRLDLGTLLFGSTGTVFSLEDNKNDSNVILVASRTSEPEWQPGIFGTIEKYSRVNVFQQFNLGIISLSELAQFNEDPRVLASNWMKPPVGSLLLLLLLAIPLMTYINGAIMAIQRYGYFVLAQANFKKFMNERLEWASTQIQPIVPNVTLPSNAQQMLDILEQSKGSLWPLRPGPPVRRMQSKVCIDLEAATMQLNNLLYFFPTGGKPDNFRGQHFEIAVQKIIDASSWCPPENIKRIRGLPLRHSSRGKNAVTDIDALGVREDILLIVSCKSIPYSEYYDAGDYSAVRSAISTIQEAVKQWNEIKTFLERNPTGNNYDLSDYRQIIAVVCTPHVYYAPLGQPTYFIASGLCAAVSYQELKTWLSAPEQESLGNANISSQ